MEPVSLILGIVGGIAAGLVVAKVASGGKAAAAEKAAQAEAKQLIDGAQTEVEEIKKSAQVEGKEIAFKLKAQAEEENRQRKSELAKREEALIQGKRDIENGKKAALKKEKELERRTRNVENREKAVDAMADEAEAVQEKAKARLEQVAGLSAEEAKERLAEQMRGEARASIAGELKSIEDEAEKEAAAKSKTIIAAAIQRYASEFVGERTVAVIPLPSDDLKGRLIGREGRNIRALEAAAGIDMIIDDTSESITVSCFNPVRREIARLAVSKLVADGRIHPTRIEEVVRDCAKQIDAVCKEAGEQAVFDLGLHKVHPQLVLQLGRLKYRSSYAQNLLDHSIEVGFLAGLIAGELGVSVKMARRAGLLHDIGKSVDHELEGSHAEVGAQFARKHGESPKVCQAIASHHGDPEPKALLDHVVDAANLLSAARPGARRELLASYVKRLEDIEKLAMNHAGVTQAYAVQAGREVRVMVENDKVDDAQARLLSKDIAGDIEKQATYPGQVRVVVIRETRAADYAR